MTTKTALSLLNFVSRRSIIAHRHARIQSSMFQQSTDTATTITSSSTTSKIQRSNMVTVTQTSASKELPSQVKVTPSSSSSSSSSSNQRRLTKQDNDSIIITQSALQQIHHLAKQKRPEDPSQVYLRVYVDAGGCSGFQYKFELEQKDKEDQSIDEDEDVVIHITDGTDSNQMNGTIEEERVTKACVVVDDTSLNYLKGSTLDYVREMIRSSFVIANNPQSESACGCGSSFAAKNFASNPALD
jgi:iron-sulfur cluster assembly 2